MIQYTLPTDAVLVGRPCPVCEYLDSRHIFTKRGFKYCRCNRCGMVYISPFPNAKALKKTYDQLGSNWYVIPRKVAIDFHSTRFDRELAILARAGSHGHLLDIGCSTGAFMIAAKKNGFVDIQGIDISTPAVQLAQGKGLKAFSADFVSGIIPSESCDVVTIWATLEHVPNPSQFVA